VAKHWNTDHLVAPFPHEPSQPVTFSSYYERCWKGEIPFIVGHFRLGVEADGPDAGLFQLVKRPGDVHDIGDRHVVDGAGRGLGRRSFERRRAAGLPDHAAPAARIHRAKNGADVLRILDFVEHHDQRRPLVRRREVFERRFGSPFDLGHDPLMRAAFRCPIELVARDVANAYRMAARFLEQALQAIVGALRDEDFLRATGLDGLEDGIHPVDNHAASRTRGAT
jgi:hypothetical protein